MVSVKEVLVVSHVCTNGVYGYIMSNGNIITYEELCAWLSVGGRTVSYN